jgi:hypothetical protein
MNGRCGEVAMSVNGREFVLMTCVSGHRSVVGIDQQEVYTDQIREQ